MSLSEIKKQNMKEKHVEKIIKKHGYKVYPVLEKLEVLLLRNPRLNAHLSRVLVLSICQIVSRYSGQIPSLSSTLPVKDRPETTPGCRAGMKQLLTSMRQVQYCRNYQSITDGAKCHFVTGYGVSRHSTLSALCSYGFVPDPAVVTRCCQ